MEFLFKKKMTVLFIIFLISGCNDRVIDVKEHRSEFEIIEHGCMHMEDIGITVNADSTMPGPNLEKEELNHRRLNIVLVKTADDGNFGYIHFGAEIAVEMFVMTNEDVPLTIVNRTDSVFKELYIEKTFNSRQIADSTGCVLIKKAVVFEAKAGDIIIKIGPAAVDTVSIIIEEHGDEHNH